MQRIIEQIIINIETKLQSIDPFDRAQSIERCRLERRLEGYSQKLNEITLKEDD